MRVLTRPPGSDAEAATDAASAPGSSPQPTAALATAAPRVRLRLPHGLTSTKFALIVGVILAAGLVSLLVVNTSLAAGAIKLSGLESALARATEQREALEVEVDGISSPAALQRAAAELGMVPATSPAFLDPATGAVSGDLSPATAPAEPFEQAPQVAPEPTPTPAPGEGQPNDDASGSAAGELVPGALSASPDPTPTAPVPVDPGADGAVVIRPGAAPAPVPSAVPSPTPAPIPIAGDAASVVTQEGD